MAFFSDLFNRLGSSSSTGGGIFSQIAKILKPVTDTTTTPTPAPTSPLTSLTGRAGYVPRWVTAPEAGSVTTPGTVVLTNPQTGVIWKAPSSGYSVSQDVIDAVAARAKRIADRAAALSGSTTGGTTTPPATTPATTPSGSTATPATTTAGNSGSTPAAVNASPLAMLAAQSLTPATAANAAIAAPQRAAGVELPSYAALPALNLPSSSLLGAVGATPSWQYQLPVGVPPGLQLRSGAGGEFTPAQLQLIMLGQPRAPQLSPLQQYAGEQ